jgi:hypothetical protein
MSVFTTILHPLLLCAMLPGLVACGLESGATTRPANSPPAPETAAKVTSTVPVSATPFPMGTNLAGIADWSTQYPFLNYVKNSRAWITRGTTVWDTEERRKLSLDADGWVKSLTGGSFTSVGTFIPNDEQGRRFVVLYEGEGTLEYNGLEKDNAASKPGREVVRAIPGQSLYLGITKADPQRTGNYLRNLRIIPEAYEKTASNQRFNPDFLKSLKGYKTLRFMDWMGTNNSQQKEWRDRPKPGDMAYAERGVPVEVMVDLANQMGIDPWFNMPHQATDDYVRNFARYVKAHLNPKLKVYVEYSNETWNFQFGQATYAVEQGKRTFTKTPGSDFDKQRLWFGRRTGQMLQIWDQVYGTERSRVMGVLAAQGANVYTASKSLEALTGSGKTLKDWGVDAVAIASYFGYYLGNPENTSTITAWTQAADGGLNQLFQELTQGGLLKNSPPGGALQETATQTQAYSQFAKSQGLQLLAYEGGQHLVVGVGGVENDAKITALFIAANRDRRMGDLYRNHLRQWQQHGGGLFANFIDVAGPSKWGSWGIRESLYQPTSPKAQAVQEFK